MEHMKKTIHWIAVMAIGTGVIMLGTSCTKYGKRGKKKDGYTAADYLDIGESGGMDSDNLPLGEVPFDDPSNFSGGQLAPVHFSCLEIVMAPHHCLKL